MRIARLPLALLVGCVLFPLAEAEARCTPIQPMPLAWRITENPTLDIRYRVRGRVQKCTHQVWEELARTPYQVTVVQQPRTGRVAYNPGFRSVDYHWTTRPENGVSHRVRICGSMYDEKGCVTLNYSYIFE
jgi:hypothetical protein